MEEDCRGFWEILTYTGNSSTPIPFIPLHCTNSQTGPESLTVPARSECWMLTKSLVSTREWQYVAERPDSGWEVSEGGEGCNNAAITDDELMMLTQ
jgi:hypothetical protein